ncbi:MAG: 50S ribosomal protein L6 [Acidobacteriota bacterium]
MSRVGKKVIPVPKGAKIELKDDHCVVEGPKGKVTTSLFAECPVTIEDGEIKVARTSEAGPVRAKHGLVRALLANAVHGVTSGWTKNLEIVGVGYRGEVKGKEVVLSLGYSHPIHYAIPEGISVEIDKNNKITINGADRQQVGQVAAEIRGFRPPDPYKAKGIRYSDEQIRRKVGKAGAR